MLLSAGEEEGAAADSSPNKCGRDVRVEEELPGLVREREPGQSIQILLHTYIEGWVEGIRDFSLQLGWLDNRGCEADLSRPRFLYIYISRDPATMALCHSFN